MKPANVTYMNQYGETVVSAQKIPAWACAVCGETEFDAALEEFARRERRYGGVLGV